MKFPIQSGRKRSNFSALMPVIGLLMAAALAKLSVATQFFHLTH